MTDQTTYKRSDWQKALASGPQPRFKIDDRVCIRQEADVPAWASDWAGVPLTIVGIRARRKVDQFEYEVEDDGYIVCTDEIEEAWLEFFA